MSWFSRFKGQKVISVAAVLATLTTGILIGTLINSDVSADKGQVAGDATPLVQRAQHDRDAHAAHSLTATTESLYAQCSARGSGKRLYSGLNTP